MAGNENRIQIGDLILIPSNGKAYLGGLPLSLTKTEFGLLLFLIRSEGQEFSRKQIIEAVHGPDYPATDRSIDNQIMGLRGKLGAYGRLIETVRGVGYRYRKEQ